MRNFTEVDEAQMGLWMIRQAILRLLTDKGPMQPSQVRNELGLQAEGEAPPGVALGVMTLMVDIGELVKGDGHHPTYSAAIAPARLPSTHS